MRVDRKKLILAVMAAVLVLTAVFFAVPPKFRAEVTASSRAYGVDVNLVYAVIRVESNFDKNAVSPAGAIGLMQLVPETARWLSGEELSVESLKAPALNVRLGTKYLAYLSESFPEFWQVLAAYNAGETKVRDWLQNGVTADSIPYTETKNFVKKVTGFYRFYGVKLYLWTR